MDVNAQADASRTLQYITQTAGPCNDLRPAQCMEAYTTTATPNRYNDPKIDEWQNIILTSTDPAVRKKALWEAEKYFLLDMAYNAPFLREEVVAPYRTYLKGSVVPGARAHDNSDRSTDWIDKSLK
jgi:ABC-type transport system substrate-binding protein